MKKLIILLCILALFLVSCVNKDDSSKKIIQDNIKNEDLLTDIYKSNIKEPEKVKDYI